MADIPSVAMEHEDCELLGLLFVRWSNEESAQRFAIRCGYSKIFVVEDTKFIWSRDPFVRPCSYWQITRINELTWWLSVL